MAEHVYVNPQNRTKDDALVIPLDDIRSCYGITATITSGVSSILLAINSGRDVYLRQAAFCELSGNQGLVQLHDTAGSGIGVPWQVAATSDVVWDTQDNSAYGEIISGITVQSPRFSGEVHLIVNINPNVHE